MRLVLLSLFLASTSMAQPTPSEPRAPQDGATGVVTLLHTNDFHGRTGPITVTSEDATAQADDPGGPPQPFGRTGEIGGFAAQATVVARLREELGADRTVLVHAGDAFSDDLLANLTEGEAVVRLMNRLGYAFMALGNHDFDYGVARTRALQEIADFPMRGANVIDEATGEPFLGDPTLVVDRGGLRVGLLALGYPNTEWTASPEAVRGLRFTSGVEAARGAVTALRERADLVVVVSHQGTTVDRVLAREVPGIDVILGGHSHNLIVPPERVGNTWITEARSDGLDVGQIDVTVRDGRVVGVEQTVYALWSDRVAPDASVAALVDSLRAPHRARLDEVLATAEEAVPREYKTESPFDRLVGDVLRAETGAAVALLPGVGYGVTLGPGPVTREALYTLLPHPATLVTVELTGAQILQVLEQSAANLAPASPERTVGGLVQSSGLGYTMDLGRPLGTRVSDVLVEGEPLDPARWYRVATHSGVLAGTHRYEAVGQGRCVERSDRRVTDLVEAHLIQAGTVRAPATGGVTVRHAAP